MGIDHQTAIAHSAQYVARWDAEVNGESISLRALVIPVSRINSWWYGRPLPGTSIPKLLEGQYAVVYRNGDGTVLQLGRVHVKRSDHVPEPTWQWSLQERHNRPLNLPGANSAPAG